MTLMESTSCMDIFNWIYWRVSSIIFLLRSFGKSLLQYINSCATTLFERLVYPNGRSNSMTPAGRFRRSTSKAGQSNKKCSVVSMPSLLRHIGSVESIKLCLNSWKHNLLSHTLRLVR